MIKDAYSYAGTENICNFMSECLGDEHDVTIYSLEGHGQPFYPFEKVKRIVSFEGESNPIKSAVARIQQEGFDTVFMISMGRLSVMFAFWNLMTFKKKRFKAYACEHVAINSFSKPIKFLKFLLLRYYDRVIVLTDKDHQVFQRWHIPSQTIPNPVVYKAWQRTSRHRQALAVGRLDNQRVLTCYWISGATLPKPIQTGPWSLPVTASCASSCTIRLPCWASPPA